MLAVLLAAAALALQSRDIAPDGRIGRAQAWNRDGCAGENRSPELHWRGVPANAKSLAVTMFDPDVSGHGWWHWVAYDIAPGRRALPSGVSAAGHMREGTNDFGTAGYGGPCPPPGPSHRYELTLYALDVAHLAAPARSRDAELATLLRAHVLSKATIVGRYAR